MRGVANHLGLHERIEIRGFGSFGINTLPPRMGRNPKTGDKVVVPATRPLRILGLGWNSGRRLTGVPQSENAWPHNWGIQI